MAERGGGGGEVTAADGRSRKGGGGGGGGLVDGVMGLMGDIRWASMLGPSSLLE